MRLLAAVSGAVFAYLTVGHFTGHAPRSLRRRPPVALWARRRSRPATRIWLEQAGASVTPAQFVGVSVGIALVAFAATWAVSGAAPVGLVPALVVAGLPRA